MAYDTEKQVALKAAIAAAKLCQQVRQEITPEAIQKHDRSPVTTADFGSQALICQALAAAFPSDAVVGEEDAATLRQDDMSQQLAQVTQYVQVIAPTATPDQVVDWIDHGNGQVSSRYWTLDPIDGTKGFLRGDQYAVALALVEEGDVKVGVLACPALEMGGQHGVVLVAVRGQGTELLTLEGTPIKSVQVAKPEDTTRLRFVESVESGHGDQSQQSAVAKAVGITANSIRMDSQAKYAAVAMGEAVLYLRLPSPKSPDYQEKIWDHAAGVLVVEEAGGQVTDMHGKSLDFATSDRMIENRGVVVSNGTIHDTVLKALAVSS
ncbi:MAG: 3'(2'),5'-bisphosphate nucleotidase [Leptolyngbyaceae cyanobacterium SL_1_1]|nr:3'(2'),5'-bisphosphate nucleotidase [Leptolyngbyaceae cyanobacterium RM1_1_2]NJO11462.1 3'(2'),5'-bisphosphate nucleotidase [Leptolyngbyaceae cyanobacterium SL_1_1]